jgi:Ca-activated chloride channel family protein
LSAAGAALMFEQFHFLRPYWLLALLPLAALIWQLMKSKYASGNWRTVVDPELLPHLLTAKARAGHKRLLVPVALVGIVAVIALAGPAWETVPQPVYKQRASLVIALDLSRSMNVNDIKPSRLTRARHKIADILSQRREGQSALIAYAADAFVVTPLTEDVATINALLPSLSTDIMPAQGGRADRAVGQALELFNNTGVTRGDILIVTDGFSAVEVIEIERLVREYPGFRISVLGIGTESGGPISLAGGGFLKDSQGSIVITRMQIEAMREITRKASGVFSAISIDDGDIQALLNHIKSNPIDSGLLAADQHADIWREQGPLLILALLPLMSLVFRRGVLLILPLLLLPYPPDADAMSWDELWQNRNQRGSLLFDRGAHDAAANLFDDAQWKASSLYRAGKYDQALQFWTEDDTGDSQYNRGNALAKLGRYEDAIRAYQQVLDANPQHRDASYNKKLIEELLQQQQPQQQQNQDDKDSQDSGDSSQDQNLGDGQQQAQSESDSSQTDQQNEQNSTNQKPRSEQQDGSEAQASQAQQSESSEESSPATDATEVGGEDGDEMSEQAANQWLRKIPDDPGGLLRRKFIYQYKSRGYKTKELNQW